MIIDLVNKLIKPITIIALVSIVSTWVFNIQNVLIYDAVYNGIKIKVVDMRIYLENLSKSWQTYALSFDDILPSRTWDNTAAWNNWDGIFNNMAYLFDWLYFPINFILWIFRWICWLIKLALALIGWNVGVDANGIYYSSLIQVLTWITENLFIPYI